MTVGSLFSGVGGLELGLEVVGCTTQYHVERDPQCQSILQRHWPSSIIHPDITLFTPNQHVDIIAGGFPCQDISNGNVKGKGLEGKRSGLWTEMLRVIKETQPKYVVIENVSALRKRGLSTVLYDLAEAGFDAEWTTVRASDVGAPHQRERLFVVAYTTSQRQSIRGTEHIRIVFTEPPTQSRYWKDTVAPSRLQRVVDGIPEGLDRLRMCGNAVVPQIAEYIGRKLKEFDEQ